MLTIISIAYMGLAVAAALLWGRFTGVGCGSIKQ